MHAGIFALKSSEERPMALALALYKDQEGVHAFTARRASDFGGRFRLQSLSNALTTTRFRNARKSFRRIAEKFSSGRKVLVLGGGAAKSFGRVRSLILL